MSIFKLFSLLMLLVLSACGKEEQKSSELGLTNFDRIRMAQEQLNANLAAHYVKSINQLIYNGPNHYLPNHEAYLTFAQSVRDSFDHFEIINEKNKPYLGDIFVVSSHTLTNYRLDVLSNLDRDIETLTQNMLMVADRHKTKVNQSLNGLKGFATQLAAVKRDNTFQEIFNLADEVNDFAKTTNEFLSGLSIEVSVQNSSAPKLKLQKLQNATEEYKQYGDLNKLKDNSIKELVSISWILSQNTNLLDQLGNLEQKINTLFNTIYNQYSSAHKVEPFAQFSKLVVIPFYQMASVITFIHQDQITASGSKLFYTFDRNQLPAEYHRFYFLIAAIANLTY